MSECDREGREPIAAIREAHDSRCERRPSPATCRDGRGICVDLTPREWCGTCREAALLAEIDALRKEVEEKEAERVDEYLCVDGVKHTTRCSNSVFGDERWGPCLRCQAHSNRDRAERAEAQVASLTAARDRVTALPAQWRYNSGAAKKNADSAKIPELDRRQCFGVHQAYAQCADELSEALASVSPSLASLKATAHEQGITLVDAADQISPVSPPSDPQKEEPRRSREQVTIRCGGCGHDAQRHRNDAVNADYSCRDCACGCFSVGKSPASLASQEPPQ